MIRAEDLRRVFDAVKGVGYSLEGGMIPLGFGEEQEQELHRISKVQGRDLMTLDLLLVHPPFEPVWATRERFEWMGREIKVVSRTGLAIMKRLSGRPQVLVDLQRLGIDTL